MKLEDILSLAKDTDELVIGTDMAEKCGPIFKKHWPGKSAVIVADTITWGVAGEKLSESLAADGIKVHEPIIFEVPPILHADHEYCEEIIGKTEDIDDAILIAAGSGTINDITKRASFELERGYLCYGTAASVDGYCASGAALGYHGVKMTMECPAPTVVMADSDILKDAPVEASSAGYGDLASKYPAGADWIIAEFTGFSTIHKQAWDAVHLKLNEWLEGPEKIKVGDPDAISRVFEGLNFCGLSMQIRGDSRSASGAEHLFSHIWEMSGHVGADGERVSHGFQVSVGILCVTALMEEIFARRASDIDVDKAVAAYPSWEERAASIEKHMGGFPGWENYLKTGKVKQRSPELLRETLNLVKDGWDELRTRVWNKLPRYSEMRKILETSGCPVRPLDINLSREAAVATYAKAHCMRKRYTSLDLAYELGIFDECVQRIAESKVYLR